MASKTDTSTAGRSDPATAIQGTRDPKIKRALEWIERLLTSVKGLKGRAENEQTYYCFLNWGLDRGNTATAKAVASSLKSIGYAGEAARIRSLHKGLARTVKDMLVRSDPAYVPASEYEMAYLVAGGTSDAAHLERALLEVQTLVSRDAQERSPTNQGGKSDDPGTVHPQADQGGTKDDPDTPLSPAKLADRLGIPKSNAKGREALRKRLESWRKANPDGGWIEARDPKPREPKYLYPVGKVWPLIQDLKPSG